MNDVEQFLRERAIKKLKEDVSFTKEEDAKYWKAWLAAERILDRNRRATDEAYAACVAVIEKTRFSSQTKINILVKLRRRIRNYSLSVRMSTGEVALAGKG